MKPYTVDFASQTITITSAFAQEMTTPGSEAYETVRQLHQDCQAHTPHAKPLYQQTGRHLQMQSL